MNWKLKPKVASYNDMIMIIYTVSTCLRLADDLLTWVESHGACICFSSFVLAFSGWALPAPASSLPKTAARLPLEPRLHVSLSSRSRLAAVYWYTDVSLDFWDAAPCWMSVLPNSQPLTILHRLFTIHSIHNKNVCRRQCGLTLLTFLFIK